MGAADWWFRSQTLDMLSSLCANVQELAARGDVVYKILIWDAPGSLMGLKHVTLVQARSRRALDLTVLSQVATTAPNLPTVKFHPVRHTSVFDPPVSLPSMAKLVKLNLPDAYVCHEAFCSILAACPNLQFFLLETNSHDFTVISQMMELTAVGLGCSEQPRSPQLKVVPLSVLSSGHCPDLLFIAYCSGPGTPLTLMHRQPSFRVSSATTSNTSPTRRPPSMDPTSSSPRARLSGL
jgi:hypothetical protein